jgi:hypothetical protein
MPGQIKDYIHGYRADPTRKHGGKDYMETLPTEFDRYNLQKYIDVMQKGKPYGVPQLSNEELANMALHEGRDDFGFNSIKASVQHSKDAKNIVENLKKQGIEEEDALFAGLLYDKHQTAKRLNKPFEEIWNGTGISMYGKSGADYAREANRTKYAATHPKNAELVDYINRARNYQLTPQEDTVNKVRRYEDNPNGDLLGMGFYNELKGNIKDPNALKILKDADPLTLQQIYFNKIREVHGINPGPTDTQFKEGAGMGDYVQAAHVAAQLPSVQQYMDSKLQDAIKTIGAKTPTFKAGGKVKLPDGYKQGGSSSLI